jgi:hypothetical protein
MTTRKCDTQHNDNAKCHYAECPNLVYYPECHYAECRYDEVEALDSNPGP